MTDHELRAIYEYLSAIPCVTGLKQAGLVRDRHEGRQTHYSAQFGALAPLIDWTGQMAGFWQSRFDRLEDLLKRMDQ
jgi:hypothetical protein